MSSELYMLERKNDLLQQIISVMNTTTKLENLLNYINDLMTMVTTSEASVMMIKEVVDGDNLTVRAVAGLNKKKLIGKEWPISEGIIGEVYCGGRERTANNASADSSFSPNMNGFLETSIKSLMALPLNCEGKMVGAIEIINKKDGLAFNDDDMAMAQILADQAAAIIGQGTSFKSTEAKFKRFNTLMDVAREIAKLDDLHSLLEKIMEASKSVMRAEASSLFLLDEKANELYIESAQGEAGATMKQFRLPLGKGIAGWVAQKGKPDLIKDAYQDNRFNSDFDKKTGFRTKSIVCVPLEYQGKVKGVVQIINSLDKEAFEDDDVEFMMALGGQAAVAIENARLLKANKELFLNVVMSLVKLIDQRHAYFNNHSLRVAKYAVAIARTLGLTGDTIEKMQVSAFLHDVGRTQIPDGILLKPGQLAPQEMEMVKKQPLVGAKFLQGIAMLEYAVPVVLYHMEHFNGKGYPKGIAGDQIPMLARILAVANVFDALTSPRPQRQPLDPVAAKGRISALAGSQFDPMVVQAFTKAFEAKMIVG